MTTTNPHNFVLCESPDGWSLHPPDATDEQIAAGATDARYLVDGPGEPTAADYRAAWLAWLQRIDGQRVSGGAGDDYDTGRCVAPDADDMADPMAHPGNVYVAWDSGVRTWAPADVLDAGGTDYAAAIRDAGSLDALLAALRQYRG